MKFGKNHKANTPRHNQLIINFLVPVFVAIIPILIAISSMNLWVWDLSIPLDYRLNNSDETWQLILTKMVVDTGWILTNPFLGAPDVAHWHNNAAAQTSALHSVLMYGLSKVISNSIAVQQVYYFLNFSLISLTTFISCRLLGVARLPAFCIGLMFSLLSYKFNYIAYSFLPNYFVVPLAMVVVYWIMTGEFFKPFIIADNTQRNVLKEVISSSKFLLGLLFIVLIAISDGYYAFFTLLLLGFTLAVRALSGDIKRPVSLLVPLVYIATLLASALLLSSPLTTYKNNHREEFSPNGIQDPSLVKHASEAEIYSLNLKLLVAPSTRHRITPLADLGKKMIATSDAVRSVKTQIVYVPLGILGVILFAASLMMLMVPRFFHFDSDAAVERCSVSMPHMIWASSALALFIFLCSITGGIGTLVALVYPTIRAYDRFPLFLIFVLYVGAGAAATMALERSRGKWRTVLKGFLILVMILSLYDQSPNNIVMGSDEVRSRFLAEKGFVKSIEADLPANAMVYQYPYSQWLTDSDYYGWGSFAQVRLYLHSATLRWSNGASKNSPVDDWHLRLSRLPIKQLLSEVQAAGFSAVVVDRRFFSPAEYRRVRAALIKHSSAEPLEDTVSELAFFKLRDPGYRLQYDESYKDVAKLVISDASQFIEAPPSQLVNFLALKVLLEKNHNRSELIVDSNEHPEVFFTSAQLNRGIGEKPIVPLTDMQGEFKCTVLSSTSTSIGSGGDTLILTLENRSDFDWVFNQGHLPLMIGVHLRKLDGTMLRWDDGLRLPTGTHGYVTGKVTRNAPLSISRGTSAQVQFPLSGLNLQGFGGGHQNLIADFRMVQDGHAWFENIGCKVTIRS